ncbi:MAG TPA: DUF2381 family protein [Myxococcus sp.]|nr:DUF2381 family protein [Myxococcus sp.]
MVRALPGRFVLLWGFLASAALARDRDKVGVRTLLLSEHPANSAHRVYVTGQVVTVLRFEQPVDPARTKLLGWEGRFEPPGAVERKLVLEPLRDLESEEEVPLLVVLADGTEVSFLLRDAGSKAADRADQQVNVFKDRKSYESIHSLLEDSLKRERELEAEVTRLRKEEGSADHALAALLLSDAVKQTLFRSRQRWLVEDADSDIVVDVFSGKGKAAVVVKLKNRDPARPWSVSRTRLVPVSGGDERPIAFRAELPSIPPGQSGSFAFVADKSAFTAGGSPENLALEVYRQDGLRQAYIVLDHRLVRE